MKEADRLVALGFKVEFEDKNDAAGYDVDVAAISPATGEVKQVLQCKQADKFSESSLRNNLKKAAGQLTKAPGEQKWVVIHFPDGKVAELDKPPYKDVLTSFAGGGKTRARIVMPDGVREY